MPAVPVPTLIRNVWLCPLHDGRASPVFGDLVLEGGRLHSFKPRSFARYLGELLRRGPSAPEARPASSAERPVSSAERPAPTARRAPGTAGEIDAAGRVLTAPRVNFHEHFYSRLAKGLDLGRPMDSFVRILENFWWALDRALDPDMVAACARLGALEAIRSGATVVFDHHASPGCIPGSLDLIAGALREAGLRGVVCYETSDRGGGAEAEAGLAENRRFLERGPLRQFLVDVTLVLRYLYLGADPEALAEIYYGRGEGGG